MDVDEEVLERMEVDYHDWKTREKIAESWLKARRMRLLAIQKKETIRKEIERKSAEKFVDAFEKEFHLKNKCELDTTSFLR